MLSVDAVGAFDHVARQAMFSGLFERPALQPVLPYADGVGHVVHQGEGGEQGGPLMPATPRARGGARPAAP